MKFPNRMDDLNNYLASAIENIDVVYTLYDDKAAGDEAKVCDDKGRTILRAVVKCNADYILTMIVVHSPFFGIDDVRYLIL